MSVAAGGFGGRSVAVGGFGGRGVAVGGSGGPRGSVSIHLNGGRGGGRVVGRREKISGYVNFLFTVYSLFF